MDATPTSWYLCRPLAVDLDTACAALERLRIGASYGRLRRVRLGRTRLDLDLGVPGAPRPELRARLTGGGLRPGVRVQVELAPWSRDRAQLGIRMRSRHPDRWSARRAERCFAAAHAALGWLAASAEQPRPAPVAAHDARMPRAS